MMIPEDQNHLSFPSYILHQEPNPSSSNSTKRKRSLPGNPDPEAEVISLSPNSLIATNRFICEICNKGFKRDQNLQLHRRGHNLPWKLKQRVNKDQVKKKVYVCPHESCVHHDPARALGDLTGIKKHFSRKHGEKKWKCDKCSKKYAVLSDWKAHSKICGTKEYRCDCGTLFSRKDSFITHRAFCDALAEETSRFISVPPAAATEVNLGNINPNHQHRLQITTSSQPDQPCLNNNPFLRQSFTNHNVFASSSSSSSPHDSLQNLWHLQGQASHQWLLNENKSNVLQRGVSKNQEEHKGISSCDNYYNQNCGGIASMSATALLQKAAQMGTKRSVSSSSRSDSSSNFGLMTSSKEVGFTRDFLGVGSQQQRSWPLLMVNRSLPDLSPPVNNNGIERP